MHSWYSHRLWPYRRDLSLVQKAIHISDNTSQVLDNDKVLSDNTYLLKNLTNDSQTLYKFDENMTEIWSQGSLERSDEKAIVTPIVMLSSVLFLYNIGLGSVPYVLISELFSINVSIGVSDEAFDFV